MSEIVIVCTENCNGVVGGILTSMIAGQIYVLANESEYEMLSKRGKAVKVEDCDNNIALKQTKPQLETTIIDATAQTGVEKENSYKEEITKNDIALSKYAESWRLAIAKKNTKLALKNCVSLLREDIKNKKISIDEAEQLTGLLQNKITEIDLKLEMTSKDNPK